jgi:very-short-patch-repair endonuclease
MMTLEDCHRSNSQKDRARQLRREMTLPERSLWYALRDRRLAAWKFRRQSPIGPYIVDFFCHAAGLALEVDGRSHDDRYEADRTRQAELEARGLRVLRVSNDDVFFHVEDVLNAILGALAGDGESPSPGLRPPSPAGRG